MASARFTILISLLLYQQGIRGQQSVSVNGPSVGQNLNQVIQSPARSNENSKTVATNANGQGPVNFKSLTPQPTISTHSTVSFQPPQTITQPQNRQMSPTTNSNQHTMTVQPSLQFDTSFLQRSQNLPQQQSVYKIPLNILPAKQLNSPPSISLGDISINQPFPTMPPPAMQQIPVQSSPGIAIPRTSYTSSYPSVSAIPNYPCQHNIPNNVGNNYLASSANTYSVLGTRSGLPVAAVLSPTNMAYGNQVPEIIESPLRVSNNFFIDDEVNNNQNQDSLTSILLSLLRSSDKSPKSALQSSNSQPQNYLNNNSKSSRLKSLLPLIFDIISDRRNSCDCCGNCQNCNQQSKIKKEIEDKIFNKLLQKDGFDDHTPRLAREDKEQKTLNTPIQFDTCEDEDEDYDDCSDEED